MAITLTLCNFQIIFTLFKSFIDILISHKLLFLKIKKHLCRIHRIISFYWNFLTFYWLVTEIIVWSTSIACLTVTLCQTDRRKQKYVYVDVLSDYIADKIDFPSAIITIYLLKTIRIFFSNYCDLFSLKFHNIDCSELKNGLDFARRGQRSYLYC